MSLILGHDPMAGVGGGGAGGAGAGAGGPGGAMAGAGGRARPPPGSIQVTPEEMASIDNLVALGFSKHRAAEAFFACDKNEEMAANFLFEQGQEDEDTAMQAALNASAA